MSQQKITENYDMAAVVQQPAAAEVRVMMTFEKEQLERITTYITDNFKDILDRGVGSGVRRKKYLKLALLALDPDAQVQQQLNLATTGELREASQQVANARAVLAQPRNNNAASSSEMATQTIAVEIADGFARGRKRGWRASGQFGNVSMENQLVAPEKQHHGNRQCRLCDEWDNQAK